MPSAAVAPDTFTSDYLTNLQVNVYDVSYANPATTGAPPAGSLIGVAVYQPPIITVTGAGYAVTYPPVASVGGAPTTLITQDFTQLVLLGYTFPPDFSSVATAVFEIPAGIAEYVSPNIRIEVLGGAGN